MGKGKLMGMALGAMLGATAVTAFGMMNRQAQRKLRTFAASSAQKVSDKANEFFGK